MGSGIGALAFSRMRRARFLDCVVDSIKLSSRTATTTGSKVQTTMTMKDMKKRMTNVSGRTLYSPSHSGDVPACACSSSVTSAFSLKIGSASPLAQPSNVVSWNMVKSEIVKVPKRSPPFSRFWKKSTPRIAYMLVTSATSRKALRTGIMAADSALITSRSDLSLPMSRSTRKARSVRRELRPGTESWVARETMLTVTTMRSKVFHAS
mmetsp:Transcript_33561/g.84828  ORF Transcript_33561/g.84828 Transcript_33561/m.84828 type:complete len:208 (+) Transcript_33561:243-866(+)